MSSDLLPGRLRRRARAALYLSSFSPAMLVLAVRLVFADVRFAALALAFAAGCALLAVAFGTFLAEETTTDWTVMDAAPADDGFAGYALGYLLPAAFVSLSDAGSIAGLAVSVILFGYLWTRTFIGYQNPVLAAMGWHSWSVRLAIPEEKPGPERRTWQVIVLTQGDWLDADHQLRVAAADGPVWFTPPRRSDVLD